jgi:SIT family siderophore-iron:H+ symporter-like MFS transporter
MGALLSFILRRVHCLKPFIVASVLVFPVAFGVLFHFRGGTDAASHKGIVGAQVLLGFGESTCVSATFLSTNIQPACGLASLPTQKVLQAATKHGNHTGVAPLFLAMSSHGSAFGSAVSSAVWTRTLTAAFLRDLPVIYRNEVMAELLLERPLISAGFPIGTETRDAVITCYRTAQRTLALTGLCLCVPLIFFSLCVRDPRLDEEKSLLHPEIAPNGDQDEERCLTSLS